MIQMIKSKIEVCIRLTEAILTEHFCLGVCQDTLKLHMHQTCLWIGSIASEYVKGKEAILNILAKESGKLPTFILTAKKFECIDHDRKSAVIAGHYIGQTTEDSNEIFRDMQRVTFVWKEQNGFLWLMHFHISNPMTNVEKDEGFPHALGIFTKEYIDAILLEDKNKFLNLKDENNVYQRISITKVIYIESFDKNCLIHLKDRDILVRASLSEIERLLEKMACQIIIRVQKSFAVNKFAVNSIKRYELLVAQKYTIPISRNRYAEIQKQLLFRNGEER